MVKINDLLFKILRQAECSPFHKVKLKVTVSIFSRQTLVFRSGVPLPSARRPSRPRARTNVQL